jgi:hypothetical protein
VVGRLDRPQLGQVALQRRVTLQLLHHLRRGLLVQLAIHVLQEHLVVNHWNSLARSPARERRNASQEKAITQLQPGRI